MASNDWQHEVVWRGMLYGQRSMLLRLTARLKKDFDLTAAQFEALSFLREAPDHTLPATALASCMLYSSGSASHLFARLTERGLVERRQDERDARVIHVALTPEGLHLARRAGAAHRQDLLKEFAPLVEPDEMQLLLRFTDRLERAEGVSKPASHLAIDTEAAPRTK